MFFGRKGALIALPFALGGLLLLIFGNGGTAKLLGAAAAGVFLFFAYVSEFGVRPDRELPPDVVATLETIPPVRATEHKVDLVLDDGSVAYGVTVSYGKYVELPLGRARLRFDPKRVVSARKMKQ